VILIVKSFLCLPRISAFFTLLFGALCVSLLAGCGQKGPLYMPQGEKGYQTTTVQTTGNSTTVSLPVNTPPASSSDSK